MSTSVVPRVSKGRVETLEAMFIEGGQAKHEDVIEREFEELFREHRRAAFRLAALLCGGDTALAEDTVSQAFADMLPRWRAGAVDEFGAYLRRCVVNNVGRTFRRRALLRRVQPQLLDGGVPAVEDDVVLQQVLWGALRMLPEKQRTAVVLYYYEELPVDDVAEMMGTSVGTTKPHLSRARERLAALLEGQL